MKGLELSEQYYKAYGEQMLQQFPHLVPYLAVGLIGGGSECLGYDDDISQDHDFGPGFCIFLPGEDLVSSRDEFKLERAYANLPKDFMGHTVNHNGRHGVIRISDFLMNHIGSRDAVLPPNAFLYIEDQYLLEVVGGKLFMDNFGAMTNIRKQLAYFPEDIRLKKLVGNLIVMSQSGQYNYERCLRRGDTGAAQLALAEFVRASIQTIYLLRKRYMPYYKWQFRGLREMGIPEHVCSGLQTLLSTGNREAEIQTKLGIMNTVSYYVVHELVTQKLSQNLTNHLDVQAQIINEKIQDSHLRNMHLMCAV